MKTTTLALLLCLLVPGAVHAAPGGDLSLLAMRSLNTSDDPAVQAVAFTAGDAATTPAQGRSVMVANGKPDGRSIGFIALADGTYAVHVLIHFFVPRSSHYEEGGTFRPTSGEIRKQGDNLYWNVGGKSYLIAQPTGWWFPDWKVVGGAVDARTTPVSGPYDDHYAVSVTMHVPSSGQ